MLKFTGIVGVNDNDVVYTFDKDCELYDQHVFRSQTQVVSAQVKVNGTWSGDIAFTDLQSTAPATKVLVTTGQVNIYRIEGKFEGVRFLQAGAVAANVEGAHLPADN